MIKDLKEFRIERESTPILDSNLSCSELILSNFIARESQKDAFTIDDIYTILRDNIIELPKEQIDTEYLQSVTLAVFIKSGKLYLICKDGPVLQETKDLQKWVHERKHDKIKNKIAKLHKNSRCNYIDESMSFLKIYLLGSDCESFSKDEIKKLLASVKNEYEQEVIVDNYYLDKLCQKMYTDLGCLYYLDGTTVRRAKNEQDWHSHLSK